jgi:hypothetical protein
MTLLSLTLITLWLALLVLGMTFAGFAHLLPAGAVALVCLSGRRDARGAHAERASARAAAAAATVAATASTTGLPLS